MEAIFSAADIGFRGSLVASFIDRLTIFLVSIPKEHKSFLLLWEPPHWYRSPYASWISCSSVHTSIILATVSSVVICFSPASSMEGKQTSNIRSRRPSNVAVSYWERVRILPSAN
uniref:Uncharacterized protein n=1 Tax=Anas platyrhynchos TaxID=8839 RepID=A0A8B9T775_ANAPL